LQQLPPILYQVLLLSARGARQLALTGLRRLFNHLEGQPQNQAGQQGNCPASSCCGGPLPGATLLQVEATLLMHISTLLKYDAALGNEWHKWFKTHGVSGDHFMLQVRLQINGLLQLVVG
jgi:Fanconi anemia group I protein